MFHSAEGETQAVTACEGVTGRAAISPCRMPQPERWSWVRGARKPLVGVPRGAECPLVDGCRESGNLPRVVRRQDAGAVQGGVCPDAVQRQTLVREGFGRGRNAPPERGSKRRTFRWRGDGSMPEPRQGWGSADGGRSVPLCQAVLHCKTQLASARRVRSGGSECNPRRGLSWGCAVPLPPPRIVAAHWLSARIRHIPPALRLRA